MMSNEEITRNIAHNVQRLLLAKAWTQRELARRTGDPYTSVVDVIKGTCTTNAGILARVADALGVRVDDLIAEPPAPKKSRRSA